mmetsp:Transcript_38653/g.81539  ORF Transcript_38653/g.81539 Transcript_38653/m.81539 type:complete len:214 (+) Transcript_38653:924-1565(+)
MFLRSVAVPILGPTVLNHHILPGAGLHNIILTAPNTRQPLCGRSPTGARGRADGSKRTDRRVAHTALRSSSVHFVGELAQSLGHCRAPIPGDGQQAQTSGAPHGQGTQPNANTAIEILSSASVHSCNLHGGGHFGDVAGLEMSTGNLIHEHRRGQRVLDHDCPRRAVKVQRATELGNLQNRSHIVHWPMHHFQGRGHHSQRCQVLRHERRGGP